jgi:hypothetical protein
MSDKVHRRKKLSSVAKWVFLVGMLSGGTMFGLTLHYWDTSPTVSDVASGKVIPRFDKFHDHYVYLTKMQDRSLLIFQLLAMACIASCITVDLMVKRLNARSKQEHD